MTRVQIMGESKGYIEEITHNYPYTKICFTRSKNDLKEDYWIADIFFDKKDPAEELYNKHIRNCYIDSIRIFYALSNKK